MGQRNPYFKWTPPPTIVSYLLYCTILSFSTFGLNSGLNFGLCMFYSSFLAHLSRRLIGELIVYPWIRRPSYVVRPSVRPTASSTMLKHLLLRNRLAYQSQILCGASLGRGNEFLFAASGSHDQDGRHAHIW